MSNDDDALYALDQFRAMIDETDVDDTTDPIVSVMVEDAPVQHLQGNAHLWPHLVRAWRMVLRQRVLVITGGFDARGERIDPSLLDQARAADLPDMAVAFYGTEEDGITLAVQQYDVVGGVRLWGPAMVPEAMAGSVPDLLARVAEAAWGPTTKEDDQ